MIIEHTIEIERPIEEVFEVATCRQRCVVWSSSHNSQMESDEPAHVGSIFTGEVHLANQVFSYRSVITESEPPHSFAYKTLEGLEATNCYSFTSTERGTLFHHAWELKQLPSSITSLLSQQTIQEALENIMARDMTQLKILMEDSVDLWALRSH